MMSFDPRPDAATPTPEPGRSAEAGSAYLAALLVLVLLTIIGLSLSLVTQTEMQIGANEKTVERAFYASDSGIALATARTLVSRRPAWSEVYKVEDPEKELISHRLDVSPFFPIGSSPCNLCDVNNAGEYGAKNYYRANHAVTSIAIRELPGSAVPLAEKSITAMVEFQPWELTPESLLAVQDERQLEKIKF
ncbi:MAG: hypothetical protein PVG07_13710 [Acidobacteriota bacterium]|jgi:hypothetical protein